MQDRYTRKGQPRQDVRDLAPNQKVVAAGKGGQKAVVGLAHGVNEYLNGIHEATVKTVNTNQGCFTVYFGGYPLDAQAGKALIRD
jgi:hypothetical protein